MQPFRDLAPVVAQMVGPMPYPALNAAFDVLFPKGIRSYWKGSYVTELTDAAIEQHLIYGPKVPEVSATMHLYPINGACHRVGAEETAFAYRDATFAPVFVAAWQDPALDKERIQWVRDYYQSLVPHSEAGGYVNFMADDDQARVPDNYRGTPHSRSWNAEQTSWGNSSRLPRAIAGSTLPVFDEYGLRNAELARPTLAPHIRFLFIDSRFCSTLLSDPASRRRPCVSLTLHLHQVG